MTAPTPRQTDCLNAIKRGIAERGFSPSYDEIGAAIGVTSKSSVARLVGGLEDRGAIRRLPNRPRGLQVVEENETDALAFLAPDVRAEVQVFARRNKMTAQAAVAEICRRYFLKVSA